jgi:hypothetical protein
MPDNTFVDEPFELEKDLEGAIQEVSESLFGSLRIYLEVKKKIGKKGKTQNIPDAYLIDLASKKNPTLYVVENELAKHHPLKHIAVQILEFSLSFETSPQKVKTIVKEVLVKSDAALDKCQKYAEENGYENVDYLLERMIYQDDAFNALVIIDEIPDELETVLLSRFKFPVEVLSLQRYVDDSGNRVYQFEPFLSEITESTLIGKATKKGSTVTIDPSDIDTIVIPAQEEGFQEVFLGENCWYAIRIHSSMIPRIKYIAAYQVAPISAITHIAKVDRIEQWKDTNKYVVYFEEPAKQIGPIELIPKGIVKAPQSSRYSNLQRIEQAKTLDDAF